MVDKDYLCECLEYNPETGDMIWKERPLHHFFNAHSWKAWNKKYAKRIAGTIDYQGYRRIGLLGRIHQAHRMAWAIMTGSFPDAEIDHIDHDRNNNKWNNLRAVTGGENQRNQTIYKNNTSGVTGVCWHKQSKKWQAQVQTNTGIFAKRFQSFNDATQAVLKARKSFNFHENHGKSL